MDVERQIDGLVGRMLSWLMQPPVRSVAAGPAAAGPAAAGPPAAEKPVAKRAVAKKPAAKRAAAKRSAVKKPAAKKPAKQSAGDLERFVEGSGRATGAGGDLAARILTALAESAEGATLAELQSSTGAQLAAVRRQLNQLLEAGKIQRGQGIGTRYRLS